jgi:hypoxanthine phosphoribosyltransferase
MANLRSEKDVWMNTLRQTKEYSYKAPSGIAHEDQEAAKQMAEIDYQEWADKANSSEEMKENRCPLDPVEEAKILIVDKITKHFDDVLFEMVCNEMGNHYIFQSQNYLTEAGYEQFEDEWFEFYHEHHGDILASIHNKLIY